MFQRAKEFIGKYERYVSPVTLVLGFVFDSLMLRRIDVFFSNALLISYLIISAGSIMLLNIHEARRADRESSTTLHAVLVFIMQFCLGGLFSASFLFYSRSGSVISSWPFLLMIVVYIVSNELLRKNYIRLGFQIAVFFTALFSYLIFFFPVIFGKMGDSIFILSGVASLVITFLFIYVLSWFAETRVRRSAPLLVLLVGGIFGLINMLYFTNLIPPIPLALKEAGIYRSVTKLDDGSYQTIGERQAWFSIFSPRPTIHITSTATLSAFSSIFAPASLSTYVLHEWQRYDDAAKQWVTTSKVNLAISGGREQGFRTYSTETGIVPGLWRVNVTTPRGQLIGRLTFSVAYSTGAEPLTTAFE